MNEFEKPTININDLEWADCGCPEKHKLFESSLMIKKVPSVISKSGRPEFMHAEVLVCKKCGKIPSFMSDHLDVPDDLKITSSPKNNSNILLS
jgi:hypothetical protein